MWGLMLLILFWIIMLPVWCKAEPRPWTSEEKSMLVWGGLGAAADIYTTLGFLNNPNNYETNPILGEHPEPLTVIIYLATEYIIAVITAHLWPDLTLPIIGKVNMRYQILYNRASQYTANACWNARLDWK